MPPPQPLLSEQAAFAKHLFIQGYPLWNPNPSLLPRDRQSVGLRIGDVGTVDERGRFDFFFNILEALPGSHGSPPNFPPIEEDDIRCDDEDLLPRVVVSSPETPWDVDQLDMLDVAGVTRRTTQYGATLSNDGAHIILPQGAQSFELGLHHRQLFENHARERGVEWLERFRDRLGWPRSNSIYLLTGFYKTCSWSIVSFGMQTAADMDPVRVYCTLVEVDERTIRDASVWQPSGRFKYKIGPPPDRQGQNNQTIFIRAITVTPNLSEQESSEQQEAGLLGRLFSLTRSLSSLGGDSNSATAMETPKSNVTIQHVPHISQASHPSEMINQYLLTKEPSAKIAVTDDSQWIAMLKSLEGGRSWTLEDLENHLEALVPVHYSIVTHNDAVYLRGKDNGSPSHPGVDRPRLETDLQNVSSRPSYGAGSPSSSHSHHHSSMNDSSTIITTSSAPLEEPSDLEQTSTSGLTKEDSWAQGVRLSRRFQRFTGDFDDLQQAISLLEDFIQSASVSDPRYLVGVTELGVALSYRFRHLGKLSDLEEAISKHKDAVQTTPDAHPNKPVHLNNLGNDCKIRFRRLGELSDLEQAISRHKNAVDLTPNSHLDKPGYLNNLGNDLRARFQRLGELSDLEQAILKHRNAIDLAPDDHLNKPGYLNDLGNDLRARFQRLGELGDLKHAISSHTKAVDLTPDKHPNKAGYLNHLGNAFKASFECLGALSDLEQALLRHTDATRLTPDGDPNKPGYLNNLGNAFFTRFERFGEPSDLEQAFSRHVDAVQLTPDGDPDKPGFLNNLGNDFFTRFKRFGELSDLEHAISRHSDAVDLAPDGHPNKPIHLNNLGNDFRARFQRLGELSDLEKAISRHGDAVDLTPDSHLNKPGYLNNLGNDFRARFERIGELKDLEHAILRHKNAVDLIPDGHPDKPGYLSHLGDAFEARFERLGELSDLEEAISRHRNAVDLTPDGHPNKPIQHLEEPSDLAPDSPLTKPGYLKDPEPVAISRQRDAAHLIPKGHPNNPSYLNTPNARFEHLRELGDPKQVISMHPGAVVPTPDSKPDKPISPVTVTQQPPSEKLR